MTSFIKWCIIRVLIQSNHLVQLMRDSTIAIILLPFLLIALAGFYILIGFFVLLTAVYGGLVFTYEWLRELDWGFNGVNVKRNK